VQEGRIVVDEQNPDRLDFHRVMPTRCGTSPIMRAVRLIHRKRPRENSLEESECYDHAYGEHVSDHVDVVHLEPTGIRVEIPVAVETEHRITTERLKAQFEERLAARTRRSRRVHP
jgi:hypothetical protein